MLILFLDKAEKGPTPGGYNPLGGWLLPVNRDIPIFGNDPGIVPVPGPINPYI